MTPTAKKPTQKKLSFSITKITALEEKISLPDKFHMSGGEALKYNFGITFTVDSANSGLSIMIRYSFLVDDIEVLTLRVQTDYNVKQLTQLWKDGDLREKGFVLFLVEISIGHARGLQSKLIKDTPLDNFYIPIIQRDKLIEKLEGFKNANSKKNKEE